jgi:hypothetical protein
VIRDAIVSMGDLAVPVLIERANSGNLDAVDDLASVGTPAAAIALIPLLDKETELATRAAWRMGSLIRNPDVEDTLRSSDFTVPSSERLDYVWVPFRDHSTIQFSYLMGRVAYLLVNAPPRTIPDSPNIDRRLAVSLCAVALFTSFRYVYQVTIPKEFESDIQKSPKFVPSNDSTGTISPYGLKLVLSHMRDDKFTPIALFLLKDCGIGAAHVAMYSELTVALRRELLARALSGTGGTPTQWADIFTPRNKPKFLAWLLMGLACTSGALVALSAIYRVVAVFAWSQVWGPPWLPWVTIGAPATMVCIIFILIWLGNVGIEIAAGIAGIIFVTATLASVSLTLFYSALLVSEVWSWHVASVLFFVVFGLILTLALVVRYRNRAFANPLRGLLEVDEDAARSRTSIIA